MMDSANAAKPPSSARRAWPCARSSPRMRLTIAAGALALAAALAALPRGITIWQAEGHVRLDIDLTASEPARVKLALLGPEGWRCSGGWQFVAGDARPHRVRWALPRLATQALGVIWARPDDGLALAERGARLLLPGSPDDEGVALAASLAAVGVADAGSPSPETERYAPPGEDALACRPDLRFELPRSSAVAPLLGGLDAPPGAAWATLRQCLPVFVAWLLLFALLATVGRRPLAALLRLLLTHRGRVAMLASVAALALAVQVASRIDAHPDQDHHARAASYYVDHWLPPAIEDPGLPRYLHPLYGLSYIETTPPQIAYFVAAKLVRLVSSDLGAEGWTRNLQAVAWLVLLLVCVSVALRPGADPAYALALVLTPQLWYVFSYFNGDGMPFAAAFLVALELGSPRSLSRQFFAAETTRGAWRKGLPLGVLLGVLLLAKLNSYVFLLFMAAYVAIEIASAAPPRRLLTLRRWALLGAMALSIAAPFLVADLARNGLGKAALVEQVRESTAAHGFRPSEIHAPAAYPGLALAARGVPLASLFSEWRWHVTTAESFMGLYGRMNVLAPAWLYVLQGAVLLAIGALGAAAVGATLRRGATRRQKGMAAAGLIVCLFGIGAAVHTSWVFDFQPQGRFLFPLLPVALLAWREVTGERRFVTTAALVPIAWAVSAYSFVAVCLAGIPR